MEIDYDDDAQWASEVKQHFDNVYQNFEATHAALEEAQQKVVSFIEFLSSSSEEVKRVIFQKITLTEWHALLDAMEKCLDDFLNYLSLIYTALDSFKNLMHSYVGDVDDLFVDITEKVVELFTSVQKGINVQMEVILEIMEKIESPSPLES